MKLEPNQVTGPNAGGPCQLVMRTTRAARVGELGRSTKSSPVNTLHREWQSVFAEQITGQFL